MSENQQFTIRRKVFTLLGAKFHVFNAQGEIIGFSKQKAFKLKEDIRIYADESMAQESVRIAARQIIDFSAAYDVVESATDTRVGVLRRKGFSSMIRDSWEILAADESPIGTITEDSMALAMVRRFIMNLIPQTFNLRDAAGNQLAEFRSHFNPFVQKMTVTVYPDCPVGPALILAAGILLVAIEGRQQ